MKFLIIIVVVAAVAAALWLRTSRQGPGATVARRHGLDDSVGPQPPSDLRLDQPSTDTGTALGGAASAEPGSDFAWEPEVDESDRGVSQSDPRDPGAGPKE